ncbi:hypothetical protein G0Q06_03860 [Puniceicoccales bacterium CK1056]|uniref:Rhamnogalacturonase A/B/Epimerase-like pectate lyase domain-containing protein n=1 Tax=Oceanipulchritudo coccoides TaxID=2706888 RepID=A0A6B2M0M0_9BACT|nr:glycosyl hydrolase family 28-related protein [Oceanipulchritudo coccoides]NDV61577.1 hypothetical protein [Oceanipulchritudo coccoides]
MNKRKLIAHLLILVLAGLPGYAIGSTPPTQINAKDFGAAGNGEKDDTKAIQAALHAAAKGNGVCYLPEGRYRLDGSLTVPDGVTLRGSYESIPHPQHPVGTVLYIYGGKGDENAKPAITLKFNATITRLMIHYPEQQAPPNVIPYPWTIQIDGEMCQVVDVAMTNPYKMIDAGTKVNELHYLRNIFACPLKIGVYVDQCYDVGRMENIHLNPNLWKRIGLDPKLPAPPADYEGSEDSYWNEMLIPYLKANLIGFKIGKTDWEYISNCFVIFAKIGFLFDDFGHRPGNALVVQSGGDVGPVAVQINQVQPHAGVQFVNCQFMGTVKIGPENKGPVKISNSGFWVIKDTPEQIVQEGASTLIVNGCHFYNWDMLEEGLPCIRATNGRMILTGSEFMQPSKKLISLEGDFIAGTITGCLFRNDQISNTSNAEVEMFANVFE